MPIQNFHAVVYKDALNDSWAIYCVECDVASQGDSPEHALDMIREAMELHFEEYDEEIVAQVDNEVGSAPLLMPFQADVAAFPEKLPPEDANNLMNPKVLQAFLRQAGCRSPTSRRLLALNPMTKCELLIPRLVNVPLAWGAAS
jgi:predicted RNase H-like HicB family nuclease